MFIEASVTPAKASLSACRGLIGRSLPNSRKSHRFGVLGSTDFADARAADLKRPAR